MLAGSVVRTFMLQRQSNFLAAWAGRTGGWRRAFLAVGMLVVAFSIIGMHQLSLDHELAAPASTTVSAAVAPNVGHQHSAAHEHETVGQVTGSGAASLGVLEPSGQHGSKAVDPPDESSGGHEDGCAGCGSHTMAFGACLLAFTLLVLSWCLAPPRVRLLPPRLLARSTILISPVHRRLPALSLAELSILRT